MLCRVCASPSVTPLYLIRDYQIHQCAQCGFGQVDITPAELTAFYDHAYFKGERAGFAQDANQPVEPSHSLWLDMELAKVTAPHPLHVLDIGPGVSAGFGQHLRRHHPGYTYECIELSDYAAAEIRSRGYTVHHGRCADPAILAACRGRFDLIVGTEVIEHDPEPHAFIAAVHAMLKPGGRCAFTTGNLAGIVAKRAKAAWYYLDPPAHVSYYTPRAAQILFEQEGFERIANFRAGFRYLDLKLKYRIPGTLLIPHLLHYPTGMTISAHRKPAPR